MESKSPIEKMKKVAEDKHLSEAPAHTFMSKQVLSITAGTRIYFAVKMLQTHRISGAPVVDNSVHLIGIISDYDLLLQAATRDVSSPLEYRHDVLAIDLDTPLKEVIVHLYRTKYRRLPVVDKTRKVVGVVSRIDVLMKLLGLP